MRYARKIINKHLPKQEGEIKGRKGYERAIKQWPFQNPGAKAFNYRNLKYDSMAGGANRSY